MKRRFPRDPVAVSDKESLIVAACAMTNALERSGITRAELARRLDVSPPYVTNLLSGTENVTVKQLVRVVAACGFDLQIRVVFPETYRGP